MSVEIAMNSVDIELDDEALDAVAGGSGSLLEATKFKQQQVALTSGTGSSAYGSYTATDLAAMNIDTSALKIGVA